MSTVAPRMPCDAPGVAYEVLTEVFHDAGSCLATLNAAFEAADADDMGRLVLAAAAQLRRLMWMADIATRPGSDPLAEKLMLSPKLCETLQAAREGAPQ